MEWREKKRKKRRWREDGERKKRRREEAALVLKGDQRERDYTAMLPAEERLLTSRYKRGRRHGLLASFVGKEAKIHLLGFA